MKSQRESLLSLSPKSLDEIFKILEDKYKLPKEVIRTATSHSLGATKSKLVRAEVKGILIHGLGSFETYLVTVNRELNKVLTSYRGGKLSRDVTVKRITELWKLRNTCMKHEIK